MNKPFLRLSKSKRPSRGVVLVVAMFLLIALSLIAVTSIRGAGSVELSMNNTRSQTLAMQAAEIALRYCEKRAINTMTSAAVDLPIDLQPAPSTDFYWQSTTLWDREIIPGAAPGVTMLPATLLNDRSDGGELYKRMPECMAQFERYATPNKRAIITVRGFGPEVAPADTSRSAPVGAEIWLQSVIQLD